jgi:RHS repeat-associated protein
LGRSCSSGTLKAEPNGSYDASGNRTQAQSVSGTNTLSLSYSVNEINQYTSVGEASPSYNSRGDLSGINGWAFSYDAFGNLSSAQSGTNAAYHYARDPLGRRAIRQSGSNTILLLNAGDTMLEAYNATSNSVSSYIYEPGIDRPLAQVLSNGSIRYVHQDVLGSVVMLTDNNGAPYQSYSYDAWGKVTARDASGSVIASSAISAPWLFTGRRFDKESGLYHYRARTYSAELGRFLQMDPIKFDAGDPNIYRYVGNDPVNGTDPWGLSEDSYRPDPFGHGTNSDGSPRDPHIDRMNKNNQNVGRYDCNGNPRNGAPKVPNSDQEKMLEAISKIQKILSKFSVWPFIIQSMINSAPQPVPGGGGTT